jgi:hypothetical protein
MTLVRREHRTIGSLPPVGPLSFGLWRFTDTDVPTAQGIVEAALDAGMNLFDNADVYGFDWGGTGFGKVEEILGSVFAVAPAPARPDGPGHQGRHHAADSVRLVADVPALGLRGVAAADGRRGDRPLPDPPARHAHASWRGRSNAGGVARRGQDP